MRVALLDVHEPGDNKDYNGGFGTSSSFGGSLLSLMLKVARGRGEYFPLVSYGYLAAILKKNGHDVKLCVNEVPRGFDLVLMHGTPIRYGKEIEFLKKIRSDTSAKIGITGPFPAVKPELYEPYCDFLVSGEPEQAVADLRDGQIPEGIVKSDAIKDLDTLPFPDWSVFPYERFRYSPVLTRRPFTFIMASRGCPYQCSYCPYLVYGQYRARNPLRVVDEIEHVQSKYGIRSLMFRDPMFSLDPRKTNAMAEEILRRKLHLEWGCETRLDHLSEASIDLWYEAGMRAIEVGIETINVEALKKARRKVIDKTHQEKILAYCDRKGIRAVGLYVFGLPDDTEATMRETIAYAKHLNTDLVNFTLCTPIPGTKFYDEIKDDIISDRWEDFDNFHVTFRHKHVEPRRLKKLAESALTSYYFRPRYITRFLRRRLFA